MTLRLIFTFHRNMMGKKERMKSVAAAMAISRNQLKCSYAEMPGGIRDITYFLGQYQSH